MMCAYFRDRARRWDRSLQTPAGITIHELRLDPVWDPLRSDPHFQQMLAKFGGK